MENNIKALVFDFIRAVKERKSLEELADFYHANIQQIEFPNAVTKNTVHRNLQDLKEGMERGRKLMQKEDYEVHRSFVAGNTVIIEVTWTGTVALQLGKLAPGGEMKAYFAQFYEFKDGKIINQRNYDCFEPFA